MTSVTPEFVCVFAPHCRTTQLYCARKNTWKATQNNATADNVTAANLRAELIAALKEDAHFTFCVHAAANTGILLKNVLQDVVHAAHTVTSRLYHNAVPTSDDS